MTEEQTSDDWRLTKINSWRTAWRSLLTNFSLTKISCYTVLELCSFAVFFFFLSDDLVGMSLAWITMAPILFAVLVAGFWAARRDLHTVCLSMSLFSPPGSLTRHFCVFSLVHFGPHVDLSVCLLVWRERERRERETERERKRDRQRERERERDRQRETERDRERQREERERERERERQTDRQTDRRAGGQPGRQTYRQADRQTKTERERERDRQRETERERERERDREREREGERLRDWKREREMCLCTFAIFCSLLLVLLCFHHFYTSAVTKQSSFFTA